jgi:hypothetical protein
MMIVLADPNVAVAQKDAAQKAQEGGIDHWIEYYKGERRKSAEKPAREPANPTARTDAPAAQDGSPAPPRKEPVSR